MPVTEITAKTVLRKQKRIDTWFCSSYGMNLYRGCAHNCAYCDGRAEQYRVEGDFGSDIEVKVNAPEVLMRELDPARRRKPFRGAFFMLGGGVTDCYQHADVKYGLARQALDLLYRFGHPVFLLTKSVRLEEDFGLIEKIHARSRAVVCVSISSVDEDISGRFEPGAPAPKERLDMVRRFADRGIPTGVCLLPVIPFVSDLPEQLEASFAAVKDAGADFILFGGMTLKEGRQQEQFYRRLEQYDPGLLHQYDILYPGDPWGNPRSDYFYHLNRLAYPLAARYNLPLRMTPRTFDKVLTENDKISVMLRQTDEILTGLGMKSTYRYAAGSVEKLEVPVSSLITGGSSRQNIRSINGVGPATEKMIREICESGTSRFYEKVMTGGAIQSLF
jgi:DNA repair photolyase